MERRRDDKIIEEEAVNDGDNGHLLMIFHPSLEALFASAYNVGHTYRRSRTERTPRHTRGPTAPLWPRCGPPASW